MPNNSFPYFRLRHFCRWHVWNHWYKIGRTLQQVTLWFNSHDVHWYNIADDIPNSICISFFYNNRIIVGFCRFISKDWIGNDFETSRHELRNKVIANYSVEFNLNISRIKKKNGVIQKCAEISQLNAFKIKIKGKVEWLSAGKKAYSNQQV